MATALERLESKVRGELEKIHPAQEAPEPGLKLVQFGWEILVGPIIEVILSLLDGCLAKSSKTDVTESAMKVNAITRYVVKRAVRKNPAIAKDDRETACQAIIATMSGNTRDEVIALLGEIDDQTPDWNLW